MRTVNRRLTRVSRLTRPAEYRHVFSDADKFADNGFNALVRANELGMARLGLIISKKCSRKAVLRNRIKRVVRDSFRLNQEMLGGNDIVIIGRSGIANKSSFYMRQVLSRLWDEISQCDKH